MIRDLRSMGPRTTAPPSSPAVAFSRDLITQSGTGADSSTRTGRAFTIGVTSPRLLTCKRGLAAHLAAQLATMTKSEDLSVCVVDADVESRDVGARFGVTDPVLLDLAKMVAVGTQQKRVEEIVTRLDPPGLSVLPTKLPPPALLPLLRTKTSALLAPLGTAYDFLVIDTSVGLGVETPEWDRTILAHIDVLLVAVTADPAAFGGALRYLNALAAAQAKGTLPSTFEVQLVLTGSDYDGSRTLLDEDALDRKLAGLPIIGSVPQLWGRQRPDGPLGADLDAGLRDRLAAVLRSLTGLE
jgi:cellulose biosynthesis protein BcsQ